MGETFGRIDWNAIFIPTVPLLELFVRGTIMYLVIFGLLRFVLKRQAGGIGTTDVLVIVCWLRLPATDSLQSTNQ